MLSAVSGECTSTASRCRNGKSNLRCSSPRWSRSVSLLNARHAQTGFPETDHKTSLHLHLEVPADRSSSRRRPDPIIHGARRLDVDVVERHVVHLLVLYLRDRHQVRSQARSSIHHEQRAVGLEARLCFRRPSARLGLQLGPKMPTLRSPKLILGISWVLDQKY